MIFKITQLLPLAFVALAATHNAGAETATVVDRELDGTRLNELAVWNVGNDKVFEIFTTDFSGNVTCYSADTLDVLWTRELGKDSLTAPVLGNFMQTGAPILACASGSGTVYFMWPASGEVISSLKTDLGFMLPPAVAARPAGDEVVLADETGFVAGFRLDGSGLSRETFRVANTAQDNTAFAAIGSMSEPPSCADLDGDGGPEVILASETGFLQIISLSPDDQQEPRRFHTRLTQNTRATTLAGIGDFSGQNAPLFGYGIGATLQFFKWTPTAEPRRAIAPVMQAPGYGNTHGHLLVGEINADPLPDLISSADSTIAARYFGRDLAGNEALLDIAPQHLTTQASPFSAPVPVTLKTGEKALIAIDNSGTAFLWQPASPENTSTRIDGVPVPAKFAPGGDLTGSGKLSMVIWNEDSFTLSVATLPVDVAPAAEAAPVLTLGVNFSRTGQWGAAWHQDYQNRLGKAAQALQAAKAMPAMEKDDPAITTDSISMLAGMDPADPAAKKLAVETGRNGGGFGLGLMGILVAVGLAILAGGVWFYRKRG